MKILNSYNYSQLRSGKRTMMGEVEYEIDFLFDILLTQRCCFGFRKIERQIWREDIVTPYVVTYAVPLRRCFQFYTKAICKIDRKLPHKQKKNR